MAERFFQKIANDVLDATEKLSVRWEEGISAILTGELPPSQADSSSGQRNDGEQEGGVGSGATQGHGEGGEDEELASSFEDELQRLQAEYGGSPLEGIAQGVIGDIMDAQIGPQTAMEHFHAFRHAIRWKEPLVLGLLTFHLVIFACCLLVSRRGRGLAPRLALMIVIGVIVRSAEYLNDYGAHHWREFSTQNYFDRRGIFVSIMLCAPLLVFSFLMLVFFLREAAQLLVQVKTAELKRKRQQPQQPQQSQQSQNKQLKKEDSNKGKKRRDKKD